MPARLPCTCIGTSPALLVVFATARASVVPARRKRGARERQRGAFALPRAGAPVATGTGGGEAADPARAADAALSTTRAARLVLFAAEGTVHGLSGLRAGLHSWELAYMLGMVGVV